MSITAKIDSHLRYGNTLIGKMQACRKEVIPTG